MNTIDPLVEPPLDDVPFELKTLDRVIKKDILQFVQSNSAVSDLLVSDFQEVMEQEAERIKTCMSNAILNHGEEYLRRYVQVRQRSLIHLAGALLHYVKSPEHLYEPEGAEVISCQVYKTLQELLTFIEKHHAKYYDPEAWLPYNYLVILVADIQADIGEISTRLGAHEINPKLIAIVLKPLREFVTNEGNNANYRGIHYLDRLRNQLMEFNCTGDNELARVLLHLNFNSEEFCNHWIAVFQAIQASAEASVESIEQLYRFHKEISQIYTNATLALDNSLPIAKERLTTWLEKELEYWEKTQRLLRDTEGDDKTQKSVETEGTIKMDLLIAQVAYFVYVLVSLKIIRNDNITRLLKVFSRIIKTTRKDAMSYEYFKGKFYKSENGTR
jgi:hypothetical protein